LLETSARTDDNLVRLKLQPYLKQPSWTVVHVFVSPGYTLQAGRKLLTISALNIHADQEEFLRLFQEVDRQCGNLRGMGLGLRELKRVPG